MEKTYDIEDRLEWTLVFLWEFGKKYGLTLSQSYRYLKRYKAIDFIDECYGYVHTQSFTSMVTEMAEYCNRHGGKLGLEEN